MSASAFEEQMRYLKREGYHVITLKQFLDFAALRQQLPRKTVVLTFDDGWKSFKEYAYPILKELGFPATLFIYTDFIGARIALSWAELKDLAQEGYDIQAHSKSHDDMRRKPTESEEDYNRRMQAGARAAAVRDPAARGNAPEDPRLPVWLSRRRRGQAREGRRLHRRSRRAPPGEPLVHAHPHDPSSAGLFRDDPR